MKYKLNAVALIQIKAHINVEYSVGISDGKQIRGYLRKGIWIIKVRREDKRES